MSLAWRRSYANLRNVEGGFVNHGQDPGGPTNAGVALKTIRNLDADGDGVFDFDLDGDGDVDAEDVKALATEPGKIETFYRECYWTPIRGDELPPHLALFTFDSAVHHGTGAAALLLQRAIGAKADGTIGPKTIEMARQAWTSGLDEMLVGRLRLFDRIVEARPTSLQFLNGWRRRVVTAYREALYLSRDLAVPGVN